jgi:hypothetical protein
MVLKFILFKAVCVFQAMFASADCNVAVDYSKDFTISHVPIDAKIQELGEIAQSVSLDPLDLADLIMRYHGNVEEVKHVCSSQYTFKRLHVQTCMYSIPQQCVVGHLLLIIWSQIG